MRNNLEFSWSETFDLRIADCDQVALAQLVEKRHACERKSINQFVCEATNTSQKPKEKQKQTVEWTLLNWKFPFYENYTKQKSMESSFFSLKIIFIANLQFEWIFKKLILLNSDRE